MDTAKSIINNIEEEIEATRLLGDLTQISLPIVLKMHTDRLQRRVDALKAVLGI